MRSINIDSSKYLFRKSKKTVDFCNYFCFSGKIYSFPYSRVGISLLMKSD
jgi:hypothetical protein